MVKIAFMEGAEHADKILQRALGGNKTLARQLSEIIEKVRLRDPKNRKNHNAAHPLTPAEVVIDETSLRLLMRLAKTIQESLMRARGRQKSAQDSLDQLQQILNNARLRDKKLKGKGAENPATK